MKELQLNNDRKRLFLKALDGYTTLDNDFDEQQTKQGLVERLNASQDAISVNGSEFVMLQQAILGYISENENTQGDSVAVSVADLGVGVGAVRLYKGVEQ